MKKSILLIAMATLCLFLKVKAQQHNTTITGKITDQKGKPIPGSTIRIKDEKVTAQTNTKGEFNIVSKNQTGTLQISILGFKSVEITFQPGKTGPFSIILTEDQSELKEVEILSTGYQSIPKERATGSFVQIDNKLLNRTVSTNLLDRLDGVSSSLVFNKNDRNINASPITIRGISTIYATRQPLIIIDNFPFEGDLSSINPNDVESITILKDAAASSIWGAFSANGVIVITSKSGKFNSTPKIEIAGNITLGAKPNLYYSPQLSSANYIDTEEFLFKKGHYNDILTSATFPVVSPVVELLDRREKDEISSAELASILEKYKPQDLRSDVAKFLYRKPLIQQYNFNISGGGNNNNYYFSAGYDHNLENVKRNQFDRITISGSNTFKFGKNNKLELTNTIYYTKNENELNGNSSTVSNYPYLKLKEADGTFAVLPNLYRQSYIDEMYKTGNYLDWSYRPLEELELNNKTNSLTEFRINTMFKYKVTNDFQVSLQHQYHQGNQKQFNLNSSESFYTRNYINQFTQFDPSKNNYSRPVPLGGILDLGYLNSISQNARFQMNYNKNWDQNNKITVLAGAEIRDVSTDFNSHRVYGYNETGSINTIDYSNVYMLTPSYNTSMINSNISHLGTANRFLSYFSNLGYNFKDRYTFSASARKDESNIFGVKTNQKGVPLWSLGLSWDIHKEPFYSLSWLPYLKLRLTNGYQGNVDNSLSSLVTAIVNPGAANPFLQPVSILSNPPNPELRWEKVNTINVGIDFSLKSWLSGSLDYYIKKSTDLIGSSPIDPTTGVSNFKGNTASMKGSGVDVTLNANNLTGKFKWNTIALFSFTKDIVKKYQLTPSTIGNAFYGINPIVGNPLYSLYSYQWAGLDSEGDPQVYFNGTPSKDYALISNSADLSNLKYNGTLNPTIFGSIRNEFSWNKLSLSVNITYKLGYSFRRPSISYFNLFGGVSSMPNDDFEARWQKPDDENHTNIPSLKYPANNLRDLAFQNSDLLVQKGDHVRIKDLGIGYELTKQQLTILPFKSIKLYSYINNIGILWRANKYGIDPDYVPFGSPIFPSPLTYSFSLKINL